MAFTDPILAGEQLVRTAISSENYIPGVSGWRIASNGAAEFDNLGIRTTVWVPQIILNGRDLQTQIIDPMPRGTLAWAAGFPTTSTTTEDGIFYLEVDIVTGRWYEISCVNITPDMGSVAGVEYHLRATYSTAGWPNNSSDMLSISLRLSQFQLGQIRTFYRAPYTGRLRLRVSIASLDGATVRNWCPGSGGIFAVYDLGLAPNQSGSSGNIPPGKSLKEFTVSINAAQIYYGDRSAYTGNFPGYVEQGYFDDNRGIRRTWCTFNATDRALIADLVGIPFTDIWICEFYLRVVNWANPGGGWPQIGYHNGTSIVIPEPAGGVPQREEYFTGGTGGFWMDMKQDGSASGSIVESMQSGYFKGMLIGPAIGAPGFQSGGDKPKLHVKYVK
jgi:hypothetical protein